MIKKGNIIYKIMCSKSNIMHVVSVVSEFMVDHGFTHWKTLKWVLEICERTISSGLVYKRLHITRKLQKGL